VEGARTEVDYFKRAQELLRRSKSLTDQALGELTRRYPDAVARAKRLDEKHLKDGSPSRSNPSSDVWRLVETVRGDVAH